MIILGIDPGLNNTGYGLVELDSDCHRLIEAGVIRTKASKPLETRLAELYNGLEEVSNEFKPDVFAIEELYSHYNHPKTAVIMGHARGVLFLVAGKSEIPVFSYPATMIKKSLTGSGHASKEQVASMIKRTFNCNEMNVQADVTDALAAALCHIAHEGRGGVF